MNFTDKSLGQLLFGRVEEILSNSALSPLERIPKYRTVLENLFKSLTSDSSYYFNDLNARMSYVFKEFTIPGHIMGKTRDLKNTANKVVHESDIPPTRIDDLRCLYNLCEIIGYFSKEPIPASIKQVYMPEVDNLKPPKVEIKIPKEALNFYAIVESVYTPQGDFSKKCRILSCSNDEMGSFKLKLWNNQDEKGYGSDLTVLADIVEPYQKIYITEVQRYADKENEYFATDRSLIILEPDYLLEAKELSECRKFSKSNHNKYEDIPELFLLNRFSKGRITDNIMIGNIVGNLLDDLITDPDYSYKKTFERVMRENSFGMLCLANIHGDYHKDNITVIYHQAAEHEPKIKDALKDIKSMENLIEPTFISDKYGIQGRLDLLSINLRDNRQKDIIELKSSKQESASGFGYYVNHEAQTICYDLLLKSTYPERTGKSLILYSSPLNQGNSFRYVAEDRFLLKQDLLMLRNKIVANELKIARGDNKPLEDLVNHDRVDHPEFIKNKLNEFRSFYANLNSLEHSYFHGFLKFIYREMQIGKVGSDDIMSSSYGFSFLWRASKEEKIENYDALVYLTVQKLDEKDNIILEIEKNLFTGTETSIREGDSVLLYPTLNPEVLNPLSSQILKCYVKSIDNEKIIVSLVNRQIDKKYFKSSQYWALERDFRELGYKQLINSLIEFFRSGKDISESILGLREPAFALLPDIPRNNLNDHQYDIVRRALAAQDYFIIQGPPGTGKTSKVLVEIVRNLAGSKFNTLIVAFTNRAVDEICDRLMELGIECLRLGRGDKPYYWSQLSGTLKLNELDQKVKETRVIVTTISTFVGSIDILNFKQFDTLIVDEASQVLEPMLLGIFRHFNKWLLIGDENQLPAVVVQNATDSSCQVAELNEIGLHNFRESLFYRLKKNAKKRGWDHCYDALKDQYRMHKDIAEFPKKYFYGGNLFEMEEYQKAPIMIDPSFRSHPYFDTLGKSRLIFIPTRKDKKFKINDEEALIASQIVQFIHDIKGNGFDPAKTVGIITPFRAQIANIRNRLNDNCKMITIDTVERFQGSERDIIIISLAINNKNQMSAIQSLNEQGVDRKLNVALTRAKEHLIVLGTEDVLIENDNYRILIEYIKSKGGYMMSPLKAQTTPTDLF